MGQKLPRCKTTFAIDEIELNPFGVVAEGKPHLGVSLGFSVGFSLAFSAAGKGAPGEGFVGLVLMLTNLLRPLGGRDPTLVGFSTGVFFGNEGPSEAFTLPNDFLITLLLWDGLDVLDPGFERGGTSGFLITFLL